MTTISCPKCGRTLRQNGELTIEGHPFPVFQCDECLVTREQPALGGAVEIALTFCTDAEGRPFDPAADDWVLRF